MKFFSHAEGYVDTENGNKYVYQYKDHLGNVRLSYLNIGTTGTPNLEIQEENNYYPFGLKHKGYNGNVGSTNIALKRKFGGKELQDDNISGTQLNWYDFGARNYDTSLGRWMNLDPLAQDYFNISPYNYVDNSPIIAFDPDGMRIAIFGDEEYRNKVLFQLALLAASGKTGNKIVMDAIASNRTLVIANVPGNTEFDGVGGENYNVLAYNADDTSKLDSDNGRNGKELERNSSTTLAHEISHFNSPNRGKGGVIVDDNDMSTGLKSDEVYAVKMENKVRSDLGMDLRTHYKGINVFGKTIRESQTYPGDHVLINDKEYSNRDKTGYSDAQKSAIFSTIYLKQKTSSYPGGYYVWGRYLTTIVKKPVPKKNLVLENAYEKQ